MRKFFITAFLFSACFLMAEGPKPAPLADALWRGYLEVDVTGQLRNHYLANRMGDNGPVGFLQDKSKMEITFLLKVPFLVNNVGEVSLVAEHSFTGVQVSNLEENFKFSEETTLEGDIKAEQEVLQKVVKVTRVEFEAPNEEIRLPNGFLLILPGGRLDKKGSLTFEGNMLFEFQGSGSYHQKTERMPPSEEFAILEESANLTRTFSLPLAFSFKMDFNKKALDMTFPVRFEGENPFVKTVENGKDIFVNNLKARCRVKLDPLFGKYAVY